MERGNLFGLIGMLLGIGSIVLIIAEILVVIVGLGPVEGLFIAWTLIIISLIVGVVGFIFSILGVKSSSSKLGIAGIIICSLMVFLIVVSFISLSTM